MTKFVLIRQKLHPFLWIPVGMLCAFGLSVAAVDATIPGERLKPNELLALCRHPATHQSPEEAAYLHENSAAMVAMMADMSAEPIGDVDQDFVAMMIPHHKGAIDMATLVLRYGHSPQIKRLAQEIIVTQQEEIAAMRLAVGQPLPQSATSQTFIPLHQTPVPVGK